MPHVAVFGQKDYQQLTIIKRMVKDLDLDIRIIGTETVRESDGLAMSSRNSYLSTAERSAATVIPRALDEAGALFLAGVRDGAEIRDKMKKIIEKEPLAVVEYIEVSDPDTLEDLGRITGSALVALAVRIGKARLIDNRVLKG
jgi:pantoate--beta-alanine ligase